MPMEQMIYALAIAMGMAQQILTMGLMTAGIYALLTYSNSKKRR